MSKLEQACENGTLKGFLATVLSLIENDYECTISAFNIVVENEDGHSVFSYTNFDNSKGEVVCK